MSDRQAGKGHFKHEEKHSQRHRGIRAWNILGMVSEKLGLVQVWWVHGKKWQAWASLVAQWLRIRLPVQGTRVRALVWEDPTCRGAARPVNHTYEPARLEPVLRNKRGRDSERPTHRDEEWPPLAANGESPRTETKTQHSQK